MDRVEKRTHSVYMYIGKSITESSLSLYSCECGSGVGTGAAAASERLLFF